MLFIFTVYTFLELYQASDKHSEWKTRPVFPLQALTLRVIYTVVCYAHTMIFSHERYGDTGASIFHIIWLEIAFQYYVFYL